jgi:hypothetical protein
MKPAPIYVLRRTVGPFSAGTRMNVLSKNQDGTMTVEYPGKTNDTIGPEDCVFDCDPGLLVKLRRRGK